MKENNSSEIKWTRVIGEDQNLFKLKLNELFKYKDLLFRFIYRDFVTLYKQTILGPIWYFIQPIMMMLAYVIVFVSGLSIFISLFSSLRERKYELSLMRVMGAAPSKLFILIILEGLILAILGYVIGIALSHIGMEILAKYMSDAYRYSFSGALFLKEELLLLAGAVAHQSSSESPSFPIIINNHNDDNHDHYLL